MPRKRDDGLPNAVPAHGGAGPGVSGDCGGGRHGGAAGGERAVPWDRAGAGDPGTGRMKPPMNADGRR